MSIVKLVQRIGVSALKSRQVNKSLLMRRSELAALATTRGAVGARIRQKTVGEISDKLIQARQARAALPKASPLVRDYDEKIKNLQRLLAAPTTDEVTARAALNQIDDLIGQQAGQFRQGTAFIQNNATEAFQEAQNAHFRTHRKRADAFARRHGADYREVLDAGSPGAAEAAKLRAAEQSLNFTWEKKSQALTKQFNNVRQTENRMFGEDLERLQAQRNNAYQDVQSAELAAESERMTLRQRLEGTYDEARDANTRVFKELEGQKSKLDSEIADLESRRQAAMDPSSGVGAAELKKFDERIANRQARLKKVEEKVKAAQRKTRTRVAGAAFAASTALTFGDEIYQGVAEKFEAQDSTRLMSMLQAEQDRQARSMALMAAQQRIIQGSRQNLMRLVQSNPHAYHEIEAGRRLAPGVVTIGGNPVERAQRLAAAGTMMATGDMARLGGPDPIMELQGLLGQ